MPVRGWLSKVIANGNEVYYLGSEMFWQQQRRPQFSNQELENFACQQGGDCIAPPSNARRPWNFLQAFQVCLFHFICIMISLISL